MRYAACALILFVIMAPASAQVEPPRLSLQSDQAESIYAPPDALTDDQGTNAGGVHMDFKFTCWTDYVYRGIDRSESGGSEDSPNLQFDGAMHFDLNRYPDLFVGVFTNVYDSDPISRFQEIRPYVGLELTVRPITVAFGNTFYIYPDRDSSNTAELWVKLAFDDSYFFRSDDPIFSPYVLAAYDYDTNQGLYLEIGIRHDFEFEETPFVLSPIARIAYVDQNKMFRTGGLPPTDPGFSAGTSGQSSGFQHYEIGLEATYTLNSLLNISARFGKLDMKGYLFYTDGIDDELRADSELYGGLGIGFSY